MRRIAEDMGGITMPAHPYRLNTVMSISHRWWTMASGVLDLKQHCTEWSLCDIKVPQSTTKASGSVCSFIALVVLWCHTVIILRSATSSLTHLLSIGPTYGNLTNAWGEGWAPFRNAGSSEEERLRDVKRKPISVNTKSTSTSTFTVNG